MLFPGTWSLSLPSSQPPHLCSLGAGSRAAADLNLEGTLEPEGLQDPCPPSPPAHAHWPRAQGAPNLLCCFWDCIQSPQTSWTSQGGHLNTDHLGEVHRDFKCWSTCVPGSVPWQPPEVSGCTPLRLPWGVMRGSSGVFLHQFVWRCGRSRHLPLSRKGLCEGSDITGHRKDPTGILQACSQILLS